MSDFYEPDEAQALREVLKEFEASVDSGSWEVAIKQEARRRVNERRQAALRVQYLAEVGKLQDAEARLQVRAKYRQLGLDI